jgi:hypothetical protein
MISAIFRHLLSLAVYTLIFVPLLTVFPILSLATPFIIWLHPTSYNYLFAEVAFWGGPVGMRLLDDLRQPSSSQQAAVEESRVFSP